LNEIVKMVPLGLRSTAIARAGHAADVEKFVRTLQTDRSEHLHRDSAEGETSFFRDFTPFELLWRLVLPGLITLRRPERKLTLWSAASSTGQEAYSLAMMLCENFPDLADWDVRIIATDISQPTREYAARGRYRRLEVNRGLPARLLLKYFERDGDEWQISDEVRAMVAFQSVDLCAPAPLAAKFDLVLLRNVLLYFPQASRSLVLANVHRMLHPHGVLLMGSGEQAEDSTDLFAAESDAGCYYYRPL
jgi:chemotaxis protein methyltransferase CheR